MSFTSCVVLTCLREYSIFLPYESISSEESDHTLQRARRDDISFGIFGAPERKSSMATTRKTLEDPRTIIITRSGIKPTIFHNSIK
jgi:hypothetical protein